MLIQSHGKGMTMRTRPERAGGSRPLALALATVLAAAAQAEAQTAASFDELPLVLRRGDRVAVTDDSGQSHTGRIIDLSPSSLSLEAVGYRLDVGPAEVMLVRQWRSDSLRNGTMIGLGVAAIPGFLLSAAAHGLASNEGGSAGEAAAGVAVLSLGVGAALGAAVDALIQDSYLIYDHRGATRKRLTVSPLLSAHRRGVAVSIGF